MTAAPAFSAGLTIAVNGAPLPDATRNKVLEARVDESLFLPSQFTIVIEDDDASVYDSGLFAPGAPVDMSFGMGDVAQVLAQAEVTRVSLSFQGGEGTLEVAGLDRGHRLAQKVTVTTFVNATDSDIAAQLARLHGLTAETDVSPVTHEYMQVDTDAYTFLTQRAMAIGFEWWVTGGVLYFKAASDSPTSTGVTLTRGDGLLSVSLRHSATSGGPPGGYTARGWDSATQAPVIGTDDGAEPAALLAGTTAPARSRFAAAMKSSGAFDGTGFVGSLPTATPDEATTLARSLAQRAAAEQFRASGEAAGNPALKAGAVVTLLGLGEQASGDYTLTSVEHSLPAGGEYTVRFRAGGADQGGLVDLLGGGSGGGGGKAPTSDGTGATAAWGATGLVPALVTNTADVDKAGKIKVQFPSLGDEDESAWARVLAVGAGNGKGMAVPYDVGDEVYVSFEHGDVRRPIVVGAVWSTANLPPVTSDLLYGPDAVSQLTVWQTRTGHKIEIQDSDSEPDSFVRITLADTTTILRLGRDQVTLDSPTPVIVTGQQDVTVTATGDLTLQGQNVTVAATATLTLQGDEVDVKGTTKATMAAAQVEATGTTSTKVSSAGQTEVGGALVKVN